MTLLPGAGEGVDTGGCTSYVGNKMATFVMQALGCDVGSINTVHFSK